MVFNVAHIVWYCSQFFIMEPGDVILTGTPPGVGMGLKPAPKFLKGGDVVRLGIDGLGACPSNRCSNPSEFDFKLGL